MDFDKKLGWCEALRNQLAENELKVENWLRLKVISGGIEDFAMISNPFLFAWCATQGIKIIM